MKKTAVDWQAFRRRFGRRTAGALVAVGLVGSGLTAATVSAAATPCVNNLFVAATADPALGDGSAGRPYRTITKAVENARRIRAAGCTNHVTIHVGFGDYFGNAVGGPMVETLPIRVDVPNIGLLGSTVLSTDSSGLPTGTVNSATTLKVDGPSPVGALIYVTPGTVGPAHNVTIAGFVLDAAGTSPTTSGIALDRAQGFSLHGNKTTGAGQGTFTRASSGSIEASYMNSNGEGAALGGGDAASPATVTVTANRSTGNSRDGLLCAGSMDTVFPFAPTSDPSSTVTDTFDTTVCNVTDNDLSGNDAGNKGADGGEGIRLMVRTPAAAGSSGHLTATISNNTIDHNPIGITVDAGFPFRETPVLYTGSVSATLQNNVISGSITTPALVTLTRADAALNPPLLLASKYLRQSTITISNIGSNTNELNGLWIDHPVQDPVDCRSLSNTLSINGKITPPQRSLGLGPPLTSACPLLTP